MSTLGASEDKPASSCLEILDKNSVYNPPICFLVKTAANMLHFMVLCLSVFMVHSVGQEACSTEGTGNTLYHVTNANCSCDDNTSGTLRYYDNQLQICDGDRFVSIGDSIYEFGSKRNPAKSCDEIAEKQREAKSGMFFLQKGDAVIKSYCYMDEICGSKQWTLIMKINGAESSFHYASPYWTNKATYNTVAASGGLDDQETKLETYSRLSFTELCLGFKSGNKTNWMFLPYKANSMYSLIADGEYRKTNNGRESWMGLITGSSLQNKCFKEGFNTRDGFGTMARIGVLGSNNEKCVNAESRIGFGTGGNRCGQDDSNTVGNEARCNSDNGDKSIKGFGYIFARTQVARNDSSDAVTTDAVTTDAVTTDAVTTDAVTTDAVTTDPVMKVNSTLGSLLKPANSCLEIKQAIRDATNGLYYIVLDGNTSVVYCHMDLICNTSGWTMIMKIDGNKSTFHYNSPYWTNKTPYNIAGASGALDKQETKLKTYSYFPFMKLCLGMQTSNVTNWMSLSYTADSLHSVISKNRYIKTSNGIEAWKRLIPGSSLQTQCIKEGFNIYSGSGAKARIGITGDDRKIFHFCFSTGESRIGFGTGGSRCGQDDSNSAGNEARCDSDNGDKSIKSFGYIFAREK